MREKERGCGKRVLWHGFGGPEDEVRQAIKELGALNDLAEMDGSAKKGAGSIRKVQRERNVDSSWVDGSVEMLLGCWPLVKDAHVFYHSMD